jgi:hypothetical protein
MINFKDSVIDQLQEFRLSDQRRFNLSPSHQQTTSRGFELTPPVRAEKTR